MLGVPVEGGWANDLVADCGGYVKGIDCSTRSSGAIPGVDRPDSRGNLCLGRDSVCAHGADETAKGLTKDLASALEAPSSFRDWEITCWDPNDAGFVENATAASVYGICLTDGDKEIVLGGGCVEADVVDGDVAAATGRRKSSSGIWNTVATAATQRTFLVGEEEYDIGMSNGIDGSVCRNVKGHVAAAAAARRLGRLDGGRKEDAGLQLVRVGRAGLAKGFGDASALCSVGILGACASVGGTKLGIVLFIQADGGGAGLADGVCFWGARLLDVVARRTLGAQGADLKNVGRAACAGLEPSFWTVLLF